MKRGFVARRCLLTERLEQTIVFPFHALIKDLDGNKQQETNSGKYKHTKQHKTDRDK